MQRLMTEHDIGQVPVVEDGRVIGIVTRTDLIKLWASEGEGASKPPRVVERLESALPEALWKVLQIAAEVADDMGYNLYAVGGFVRDLLLGFPNLDLDLVVEGDAILLAQALGRRLGGEVKSHRRFGTAKWLLDREVMAGPDQSALPDHIDFATARTEFYERPSALPIVERSSIKQDLHRRDFTVNTLAITLNPGRLGEVLDFFGGLRDLDQGVIRVLHSLSFVEDPTRMLRAVRLEARLGFRIEERTAELMRDAAELLERTSGERVAAELMLILQEDAPERALARLQEFGLLERVAEGLRYGRELLTAMPAARAAASQFEVAAADLSRTYLCLLVWTSPSGQIEDLVERLRLPRALARTVSRVPDLRSAVELLSVVELPPSQVYRLLQPFDSASLLAAYAITADERARDRLLRYQTEWRRVRPEVTGADLRRWGLKPGPIYSEILEALREAVLDGLVSGREEEERLVRQWMAEPSRLAEAREGVKG